MHIAFYSTKSYDKISFDRINTKHTIDYINLPLTQHTALFANGADAVCVFVNDTLDAHCINTLAKLKIKLIALRCAGFNNVDLAAAKKAHIFVTRVPAYSPSAVAEHTLALLLTLNRKTHKAYNRVREGNFSLKGLEGFCLNGKNVGLIGLGKIGQHTAAIFKGFGCNVVAFDPYVSSQQTKMVSLDTLLSQSDIISLHCPLNEDTQHIINEKSIAKMKTLVYIINTGRGALIDSQALIKGLKQKKIAGVGLDVYEQEEGIFFDDHSDEIIYDDTLMRLMSFPNVLITSHQGFFTIEALEEIAQTTLDNISAIEAGKDCDNNLTPLK